MSWPSILLAQLNFHFSPPSSLNDAQLEKSTSALLECFKSMTEETKKEKQNKNDVLLIEDSKNNDCGQNNKSPSSPAPLDGLQITTISQLVVQYMWEMYRRKEGRFEALLPIIAFLEWARGLHPECTASMQLMLCRLYGIFGSVDRIQEMEKEIQLKFIQRDSLAFLQFFVHFRFGRVKCANIYYTSLAVMFDTNEREVNECLVSAYRNNAFGQIKSLVEFSQRATHSIFAVGADILNRVLCACFTPVLEGGFSGVLLGDERTEPIDWSKLADNRDFSVFPTIIQDKTVAELRDYSFGQMKSFFILKNALITAIGSIGSVLLEDRYANLELVLAECRALPDEDKNYEALFESFVNLRLRTLVAPENKLFDLPMLLLRTALELQQQQQNSPRKDVGGGASKIFDEKELWKEFENSIHALEQFYLASANITLDGKFPFWKSRIETLRNLSTVLELLALSLIASKLMLDPSPHPHSPKLVSSAILKESDSVAKHQLSKNDNNNNNNEASAANTKKSGRGDFASKKLEEKKQQKQQQQHLKELQQNTAMERKQLQQQRHFKPLTALRTHVIHPIGECLRRIRSFMDKHYSSQLEVDDAKFHVNEMVPELIRQPVVAMLEEHVLKWLDEGVSASVKEMDDACAHLIASFSC